MIYRLIKKLDDEDIPTILSVYKQPSISQFIRIDFVCVGKDEERWECEYRK